MDLERTPVRKVGAQAALMGHKLWLRLVYCGCGIVTAPHLLLPVF